MKLLFDENLSFRLAKALAASFPDSAHVRDVGLLGAADGEIWGDAAEHGYLLVSKDTDFYQRSLVYGAPPKVVWLRVGNAPTAWIADLLTAHAARIARFVHDQEASFLPVR